MVQAISQTSPTALFQQPWFLDTIGSRPPAAGDQQALYEALLQLPDPVVVSSYMRTGTHLTLDFVRGNFANVGAAKLPFEKNDNVYLPLDCLIDGSWNDRRIKKVLRRSGVMLGKTHWCDPDFNRIVRSPYRAIGLWLQQRARVILVQRDPYKTISSLVVWHFVQGNLDEPSIPSANWLRGQLASIRSHWNSWLRTKRPLFVSSSDRLLQAPAQVGSDLRTFLGIPPRYDQYRLPDRLRGIWHSRLNRMFACKPASTEILTMRPAPKVCWNREQLAVLKEFFP